MRDEIFVETVEFELGQTYKRSDLHACYGGQRQGGISTPKGHPLIFLFTGRTGGQYGYRDELENGMFRYTGEGQSGDMEFKAGNKVSTRTTNAAPRYSTLSTSTARTIHCPQRINIAPICSLRRWVTKGTIALLNHLTTMAR